MTETIQVITGICEHKTLTGGDGAHHGAFTQGEKEDIIFTLLVTFGRFEEWTE
jgi:hypothetical protein